jgi:hypothetical protein
LKRAAFILILLIAGLFNRMAAADLPSGTLRFDFLGDTLQIVADPSLAVPFNESLSPAAIRTFYREINRSEYLSLVSFLQTTREERKLDDWLFYQLVRKTAQQLAPKEKNYYRYTLYKWFLMVKSGYDASLSIYNDQLLFYIYSQDEVFEIPLYVKNDRQYVCLNIHDYAIASQQQVRRIEEVNIKDIEAGRSFSYKVTRLPEFNEGMYAEKEIRFPYRDSVYHFTVKLNQQVQTIFKNYPIVDYGSYFNIPMSRQTYSSLLPLLKSRLSGLKVKQGVDYLMHFTRNAFLYEDDSRHFGKEKRMAPEETLLSAKSDCDDRAALFFFLVKEIYNLPMLALVYPNHITIAVQFEKPFGNTIEYAGKKYSVCEPTPQAGNLAIGELAPQYRRQAYQIVYAYQPR